MYWSPPWKEIHEGLVCIERDADIVQMINAAETHKILVLFVDHSNYLKNLRPESISNLGGAPSSGTAGPGPSSGTTGAAPSSGTVGAGLVRSSLRSMRGNEETLDV